MRLLPGTKKFGFRTIVLTQAQQRSRLFVCLFRMPSFSAPAPPNRFRYPGTRLLRPEQDGRERLRPSGRSAAASGGPAGRPTSAARGTAIPAHGSCLPPAPPNRFRYPGARLLRPVRFFECLPVLRPRSTASACFPPRESALPSAPPPSSAPAPRTASGIPAPVCSVRFAFPEASRPCAPDRLQAPAFRPANRAFRLHRRSLRPRHPEPLPVSRHPSASSDSLFRKPPGPAAPIDRKRLFPACESCLPSAPPPSSPPAPVCSVRNRTDAKGSDPPGRSAAASGGPAGRPTPAGRGTAIPPRRSQTGCFPSTAASASRRTTPGSGTDVAYRCV